jgi:nucleoside-diphosphate-sugar epimerase
VRHIGNFSSGEFDLVVNAVGAGDPARIAAMGPDIFDITQNWDDRVLSTMAPKTRYVFVSSGAVYGGAFERFVDADTKLCLPVNRLRTISPYLAAKLHAELRHRHALDRCILDVRVFGFADPVMPLDGSSFLADLAHAVAKHETLMTSPDEMVRDYAGVDELDALIQCWLRAGAPNQSFDLYTLAPVAKHELLDLAVTRYGLQIQYSAEVKESPTGKKTVYASAFHGWAHRIDGR